ncbi:MAG TPA: thioester reductase domain-containing protein [Kofleriaceae bacterium]
MMVERHPELRAVMSSTEDLAFVLSRSSSSSHTLEAACERHADRICFVDRAGTINYRTLWRRVTALAAAWTRERIAGRDDRVGLCGAPGIDWVVADLACLYTGAVSVPLAINLPPSELRALIEHARLTTIVCGAAQLPQFAEVRGCRVIAMRNNDADRDAALSIPPGVIEIGALEAAGAPVPPMVTKRGDDLVTVMYTSGSTSRPKGVMLSEQRSLATLVTALEWPVFPHVMIGYLPHSQIAGRRFVFDVLVNGGITHFAGDALPFASMATARPTMMPMLPRVSGMLYQQFKSELVARFGPDTDPVIAIDDERGRLVMEGMRETTLGDRLCLIRVGSASTAPDVITFLERCFGVAVANGYGTTETSSVTCNGALFSHVEYKLAAVPELGYATTDRPFPRGELLVRSPENALGYLDDPAATAELFDPDGYVKTGDVVEDRGNRELLWIDRRSSVAKLAQGQFIATTRLEEMYATGSPFIDQIYLYVNPRHAFLLAVIVPSGDALRLHGDQLRRALREELDRIARATGRRSHEVPRDFVIASEPFTQENELLTESGKQNQRRLRERFSARLDELHATIEARQLATSSTDGVRGVLAIALGLARADLDAAPPGIGFVGFGGDSISALRFCTLVKEAFGVAISVGSVLDPSASLATIVARVEGLIGRDRSELAFEDVHAPGDEVRAADLDAIVPAEISAATTPAARPPAVVLLTGASGFLGQVLIFELARRLPAAGQVICLVRGADDRVARDRLRSALGDRGDQLEQLITSGRVRVCAGDLMAPLLGLASRDHEALANSIDAIVHSGALVNHALSYQQLFEPNVRGTLEIMRLAMRRRAAITFVSSIGVASRPETGAIVAETEHARTLWPARPVGGGPDDHGVGYVTSKWAGEVLLEQLHHRHGIAVNLVRCSNLAPDLEYPGHLNWADTTNRLLYSVLATRLAPQSFYAPGDATARYDLLPLGTVARSIAASACTEPTGLATYHASCGHAGPALSLDHLIDWIESAGIALTRLPHATWFAAFRDQVEQLPARQAARSTQITLSRWQTLQVRDRLAHVDTTRYRQLDQTPATVDERLVHQWISVLQEQL